MDKKKIIAVVLFLVAIGLVTLYFALNEGDPAIKRCTDMADAANRNDCIKETAVGMGDIRICQKYLAKGSA